MADAERSSGYANPAPIRCQGDPDHRLILSEDPTTKCVDDACHWGQLYTELLALAEALVLPDDAAWYRSRLMFWASRRDEISPPALRP